MVDRRSDVQIRILVSSGRRIKLERLPAHFCHQAFLVEIRLEEPAEAVELHKVVDLLLRRREERRRRRFQALDGRLPGVRVDVDRFLSAGREMSSDDLSGDFPTFVKAGVVAETSVSLARRPEVNVFMAELFLEKLLKK